MGVRGLFAPGSWLLGPRSSVTWCPQVPGLSRPAHGLSRPAHVAQPATAIAQSVAALAATAQPATALAATIRPAVTVYLFIFYHYLSIYLSILPQLTNSYL